MFLRNMKNNKKIEKNKRFPLLFLRGIDGQPYQSLLVRTCKQLNVFGKSSESLGHANCLLFKVKTDHDLTDAMNIRLEERKKMKEPNLEVL